MIAAMTGRVFLAAVASVLLLPAAPAAATSCIAPRPLLWLESADAAIIGEVVARSDDGQPVIAVRERFKGDVPELVTLIHHASSTVVPGTEWSAPVGTVTGLFLRRIDHGWTANLCDSVDPALLRRAAAARREGRRCHLPRVAAVETTTKGRHVRLAVRGEDHDGRPHSVRVSFGDGVVEQRRLRPRGKHSGVVAFGHRFRTDRIYTVTVWAFADANALCGGSEHSARRRLPIAVS